MKKMRKLPAVLILVLKFLTPASSKMKVQGRIKGAMALMMCPQSISHFSLSTNFLSALLFLRKEVRNWMRRMKAILMAMKTNPAR